MGLKVSKSHNFVTIQDTNIYFTSWDVFVVVQVHQNFIKFAHLHKTARAKIPDNLFLIHKMLILCLLESRRSQVSKTVFILMFESLQRSSSLKLN